VKVDAFKSWLALRYPKPTVAASYYSYAKRVEDAYENLDSLYEQDRLEGVVAELSYSSNDAKLRKLDPSKLGIEGNPYNQLSNFRTGVRTYRVFRDENGEAEVITDAAIELAGEAIKEKRDGKQFELERHLQDSLRREISQLEQGLQIIDGGGERAVESGFIDILAQDAAGKFTVIELKAGHAKRDAVGQILGYMGDLKDEEPGVSVRGILVAASFDKSCRSAVTIVPDLQLREYRFDFRFSSPATPV